MQAEIFPKSNYPWGWIFAWIEMASLNNVQILNMHKTEGMFNSRENILKWWSDKRKHNHISDSIKQKFENIWRNFIAEKYLKNNEKKCQLLLPSKIVRNDESHFHINGIQQPTAVFNKIAVNIIEVYWRSKY